MIDLIDMLPDLADRDREFKLVSRFFTARILFEMGAKCKVVTIEKGCVVKIVSDPGFDASWDFALRGPGPMWEKFVSDPPPPMYNDIWAMRMRVPEFVFEGNTLIAAQNARALTRFVQLLREAKASRAAA